VERKHYFVLPGKKKYTKDGDIVDISDYLSLNDT